MTDETLLSSSETDRLSPTPNRSRTVQGNKGNTVVMLLLHALTTYILPYQGR